jgi:hypothetical protein
MSGNGEPTPTPTPAPTPEPTPTPVPTPDPDPAGDKSISQAELDRILHTRSGEMKRQAEENLAKSLGVPIEEAKRLITAAQTAEDSQKSEAQLAREKADREANEAAEAKTASTLEKHQSAVERALVRAIKVPADIADDDDKTDEYLDRKVSRLARLVDVEIGADAAAIKAAVDALRKDEPLLFGSEAAGSGKPPGSAPNGDPKGTPPKRTSTESGFDKGAERAKALLGAEPYPILEANKT